MKMPTNEAAYRSFHGLPELRHRKNETRLDAWTRGENEAVTADIYSAEWHCNQHVERWLANEIEKS